MHKSHYFRRAVGALVLSASPFVFAADAGAQKEKPKTPAVDMEARVKELEQRVRDLEAELKRTHERDAHLSEKGGGFRDRHNFGRDFDDIFDKLQRELDRDLGPGFNPFGGSVGPRGMIPGNKPRMGVELAEPSDELRERFKNDVKEGAFVMSVVPGSPADKAGVSVGDVVNSFSGKAVTGPRDLIEAVKNAPQGKNEIVVTRRGEALKLKVDLGEALAEAEDTDFQPGERVQGGWLRRGDREPAGGATRSRTEVKASALQMDEGLAKTLNLSDEQRKKMNEVLDKHAKALNDDVSKTQGVKHSRKSGGFSINIGGDVNKLVDKHAQDAEKELAGTLSADQIAKWSEYRKNHSSVSFSQSTVIEGGGQRPGQVEEGGLGF